MARVHMAAFPEMFSSHMGPRYLEAFYACFLAQGMAIVASHGSEVIGLVIGGRHGIRAEFLSNSMRRFSRQVAWKFVSDRVVFGTIFGRLLGRRRKRQSAGAADNAVGEQPATTHPEHPAWLQVICVDRRFHGSTVAGDLLTSFLRKSSEAGFNSVSLSVAATNARAIAFYRKKEFETVKQHHDSLTMRIRI